MPPGYRFMQIILPNLQIEFMYALIATVLLLLIYFQTKEFYDLTKHKGIMYFRNAFLFLAIAHVFRFASNFFMLSEISVRPLPQTTRIFIVIGYALFTFISSLGILSLVYSSVYKRIKKGFFANKYSIYLLAIIMFIPVIIFNESEVFMMTQIALLIFAFVMSASSFIKKRRENKNYSTPILYGLFILFWIIGMFAAEVNPLYIGIKIAAYTISLIMILIILYKVMNKTKSNKK